MREAWWRCQALALTFAEFEQACGWGEAASEMGAFAPHRLEFLT